ncbi:hypothetical protein [Citrobacter youngae]|uniref:hypothetical protein n=1 Tax=Citrobacter youngae TaxID=133448 RepID=UPI003EE00D24
MTTNNHPAHGPLSLDRLHQIREILSKAAAQSDGGNLGYAMADAVKVINEVLEARNSEPVVLDEDPRDAFERSFKMPRHVTRCGTGYAVTEYSAWLAHDFVRMWEGWKACRAAMLQAGNSPVTPDGLALVPKRLTAENGAKGVLSGEFSETKFINCPECFGDDECETCDGSGRIEITVPVTWTTIKEIWAKGIEHFAAAPQQEVK